MENIKLEITGVKHTKEITMKKINDPSRVGDMAEHYAITYLWDKDYQVFKNCGSTGPIDMVAIDKEGNVKLIDVKSYKDGSFDLNIQLKKSEVSQGLKNILDRVLLPYQFDSQEMRNKNVETIKITAEVIDDGADPVLIFKKETNGLPQKQISR